LTPEAKRAAWKALTDACYQYERSRAAWDYVTRGPFKDAQAQTDLVEAACQVALMKGYRLPPGSRDDSTGEVVVGFGRNKGQPVSSLEPSDLEWYRNAYAENIDNPERAKWRDANQRILDAIEAEIERR
jgi:hypothetical protein